MINLKKLTALFILSAMLLTSFASFTACGGGDKPVQDADTSSGETTAAETTAPPTNEELLAATRASLPKVDFEGYTFTVLDRDESNIKWFTYDVFAENINGDPINDAVYERNSILEDLYNIKIAEKKVARPVNDAATAILAADEYFDTLTDGLTHLAKTLAAPGYVVDYHTIDTIKLSNDWWDSQMSSGLSVNNKLYYATGDISIMDNSGTWCVLFNKSMIEDFSLDKPYALVEDGTWTLSKMYDMAKVVALDIDGDGKMGDWDQYGVMSETYNTFAFWSCSGELITKKDSDDLPVLSMYNDRSAAVLELVQDIQLDLVVTITGPRHSKAMAEGVNVAFKNGLGLFIFGGMMLITDYRASEVDFGIVPAPKYDEAQERYYNTYSYGNCTAYSIPITASDLSRTGTIMESMAALSKYSLTPAYYEITLEGKFLRDEESKDMLDLVLSTRNFDLGSIYDWGGVFSIFAAMYNAKAYDFASRYAAVEEKANKAIAEFIEKINEQ